MKDELLVFMDLSILFQMLMEAVIESLKDNPHVEHASSREISKPMETETSSVKHNMHLTLTDQTKSAAASDVCEHLKADSNSSLDTSSSNTEKTSSHSDSSVSSQCSSDTDISHNTKATLTVIRNPTGHVMNGLLRRWDFNFFRKSQWLK